MVFSSVPPLLCAFGSCTLNRTSWTTRDHLQETRQFGVGCPFSRRTPYFGKLACDIEDGQTRTLLSHFSSSSFSVVHESIWTLVDFLWTRCAYCAKWFLDFISGRMRQRLSWLNYRGLEQTWRLENSRIIITTVVSYFRSNVYFFVYSTFKFFREVIVNLKFRETHLTFRSMTRDFFIFLLFICVARNVIEF